jgi:hypothetical protein
MFYQAKYLRDGADAFGETTDIPGGQRRKRTWRANDETPRTGKKLRYGIGRTDA